MQRLLQLAHGPVGQRLDRSGRDPERGGNLGLRQVEVVAQHDDLPAAAGEAADGIEQLVGPILPSAGDLAGQEVAAQQPASPVRLPGPVEHGDPQAAIGVLDRGGPEVEPGEDVLHDLLRPSPLVQHDPGQPHQIAPRPGVHREGGVGIPGGRGLHRSRSARWDRPGQPHHQRS